ncbi:hypothetical protein ENBRE01_1423 [Enteropsectra breve]|nr:hypothetical protein ENBRE01_1423 [Enteropsectra breve]
MLIGWRIFNYIKEIRTNKDFMSACNIDMRKHMQDLYRKNSNKELTIYSAASKQIELVLMDESLELRLRVWSVENTISLILEKRNVNDVHMALEDKNVSFFSEETNVFSLEFYRSCDARSFMGYASRNRQKRKFNEAMRKLTCYNEMQILAFLDANKNETNIMSFSVFLGKMEQISMRDGRLLF